MRSALLGLGILFVTASPSLVEAQATAFVGGRVIDGTGRVIERGTVVVRDGRIAGTRPTVFLHTGGLPALFSPRYADWVRRR